LVWKAPAFLVFIGGWGTALILLVIIFGALYHRYRLLDKELRPSIFYDLYLIVGSLAIALVIVYTVIRLLD
jgi:hypothetical protein